MKLHFEPSLDFQLAAIRSITDLFRGQEVCRTTFTVARDASRAVNRARGMGEIGITGIAPRAQLVSVKYLILAAKQPWKTSTNHCSNPFPFLWIVVGILSF